MLDFMDESGIMPGKDLKSTVLCRKVLMFFMEFPRGGDLAEVIRIAIVTSDGLGKPVVVFFQSFEIIHVEPGTYFNTALEQYRRYWPEWADSPLFLDRRKYVDVQPEKKPSRARSRKHAAAA